MELQVLVSKKGTQVVTSYALHQALALPEHHYNRDIVRWLMDVYDFKGEIRTPALMQDYAPRSNTRGPGIEDYFLSVELARQIVLGTQSEHKARLARQLSAISNVADSEALLNKEQVLTVLELTKVMGLVSCQRSAERQHHQRFSCQLDLRTEDWWNYRAALLGYDASKLREMMQEVGANYRGKNLRNMLLQIDKYEVIRMAVIDLFMALGKPKSEACTYGDLAKAFAKELQVDIVDDRHASPGLFPVIPRLQPELLNRLPLGKTA